MDSLSPTVRLVLALLVALYLGWVVAGSLRSGVFRYRGRRHARAEEPKTYWFGVTWFGALTLLALWYAGHLW